MGMFITYRRTGGWFALLTFAAAAIAATVLGVVVAATVIVAALAIGTCALVARAVLPRRLWHRRVPPSAPWPHETLEGTVVDPPVEPNRGEQR